MVSGWEQLIEKGGLKEVGPEKVALRKVRGRHVHFLQKRKEKVTKKAGKLNSRKKGHNTMKDCHTTP